LPKCPPLVCFPGPAALYSALFLGKLYRGLPSFTREDHFDEGLLAGDLLCVDPDRKNSHLKPDSRCLEAGRDGNAVGAYITPDALIGPVEIRKPEANSP
jgi:hypothetical protein